jgi:hypothetical protein
VPPLSIDDQSASHTKFALFLAFEDVRGLRFGISTACCIAMGSLASCARADVEIRKKCGAGLATVPAWTLRRLIQRVRVRVNHELSLKAK